VRFLAETAIPATECDWIAYIEYSDYDDEFQLGQVIRDQLARGNPVVLHGYPHNLKTVPFNSESLWRNFKIPKDQVMVVSGE
jgi:hypothetical protein